ncbi:unnamed protein product [Withania somnifera]
MVDGKVKICFSKIYNFSCMKCSFKEEHSQMGKRGFSRIVYCNDPDNPEQVQLKYRGNYVSTTKYTAINFIPKSLFEQFRRVANIYFLVVACVSFSPLAPYTASSILAPLLVVIGATMAKEGIEDWRRKRQDIEANNRKVNVYTENRTFLETRWKSLRVGDLVKIYKDEYFPADLLLLSSSYEDGICYVETSNLDGETNLKVKHALNITSSMDNDGAFQNSKAVVKCEDPNEDLYTFIGTLYYGNQQSPLSVQQILLRGSKLRNTDYVYGVVIFTGHDTKVMQNSTDPPSKRSGIEKRMDKIIYVLFGTLITIAFIGSIFFGIETKNDISGRKLRRWYLRPDKTSVFYDPKRASLAAFFHFLTALMLYGYLIPISLYVSIEIVKVLQSIFINQDREMYYEETDKPAHARTSNLNEELGQVDTILSDKTGTLTCNSMEFVKCSIAGVAYGPKRDGALEVGDTSNDVEESSDPAVNLEKSIKGFNFKDERIMNGQWVYEPHRDMIQKFFRVLAICHTVIPDVNKKTGEISYEAESPDEAAFVIAARELGFQFFERTQNRITLHELDHQSGKIVDRSYQLLHVLEFSSSRKRMSVIVKNAENQLLLLCKGADRYACSLLRPDMKQIIITLDSQDILDLEKQGNKESMAKASHASITKQIREGMSQISSSREITASFGLIIDGKSLSFALDKNLEKSFLELAINCASVICCRSTPKQKALVTRLVKVETHHTTLAIGDGANDVSMLQEADVGVGISGVEGMQAVMSSDYAIAQFRFLERLLLVHGHWCYRRISMMLCYFFYKNLTFGLTLFWFEGLASFSGQPAYNDWYMSLYNVFFTSLPVIALGVFDQDVSARLCLQFPKLYEEGTKNILFSWPRILGWMLNGVICSMIIFFGTTNSLVHHVFRKDGQPVDYGVLGVMMYTCVVWTVNCQMAISINYFTWIQHFFIWGSIAIWYVFLVVYGSLSPIISTTAYKVLVEACAPSPFYWLVTLLVVVTTLLPYVTYRAFQTEFHPMYHDQIQMVRLEGLNSDSAEESSGRGKQKILFSE